MADDSVFRPGVFRPEVFRPNFKDEEEELIYNLTKANELDDEYKKKQTGPMMQFYQDVDNPFFNEKRDAETLHIKAKIELRRFYIKHQDKAQDKIREKSTNINTRAKEIAREAINAINRNTSKGGRRRKITHRRRRHRKSTRRRRRKH
jgi:hypothetical protein